MLYLNKSIRYHFYVPAIDMRKGCFKLSGIVTNEMEADILDGDVFVFMSRHRRKIKLLQWEGDGFALYEKQLSEGNFESPLQNQATQNASTIVLDATQLQLILSGIIQSSVRLKKRYQRTG